MARQADRGPGESNRRRKLILAAFLDRDVSGDADYHALGEGYDVYIVTDASVVVSVEAHDMAVRRMVQQAAVPITWIGLSGEWQRDWGANPRSRIPSRSWPSTVGEWRRVRLGRLNFWGLPSRNTLHHRSTVALI